PSFQKSLARTSLEEVTRAPNRLHVGRVLRVTLYLLTQPADIHVNTARGDKSLGPPHGVQQLIARKHAIRPRRQKVEQAELERAHGHGFATARDAIRGRIDSQHANLEKFFRRRARLRAAQQRLDARHEFARTERFRDVIIRAQLEAHYAVRFFALGCENQDRQAIQAGVLAYLLADFKPGKLRQHEIEDEQIGWRLANLR